jgi:hypothetical protein
MYVKIQPFIATSSFITPARDITLHPFAPRPTVVLGAQYPFFPSGELEVMRYGHQ